MDFYDSPEEAEFRKTVQTFIEKEAPKAEKGLSGVNAWAGD